MRVAIKKQYKNQSEIAARERKSIERTNFCSNFVFSLYFKIKVRTLHFQIRPDQNHDSKLSSKIMKKCEQPFKKRQRTSAIQCFE